MKYSCKIRELKRKQLIIDNKNNKKMNKTLKPKSILDGTTLN